MTAEKQAIDKDLNQLTQKIAQRRIDIPSDSNHGCIGYFHNEITQILSNRKIIEFHKSLNENGFNISFSSLEKILYRHNINRYKNRKAVIQQKNITTVNVKNESSEQSSTRKTTRQIRIESEQQYKELEKKSKAKIPKSVQRIIDKQLEKERLENEQKNSSN